MPLSKYQQDLKDQWVRYLVKRIDELHHWIGSDGCHPTELESVVLGIERAMRGRCPFDETFV